MRVIITGATGFIGKVLCQELTEAGYEVVALSRNLEAGAKILGEQIKVAQWDGKTAKGWENLCDGDYAIINLAGENISSGRWTDKRKKIILDSRLNAGKAVVEAVKIAEEKPKVVIQASANPPECASLIAIPSARDSYIPAGTVTGPPSD